jgi:hypothetical protein
MNKISNSVFIDKAIFKKCPTCGFVWSTRDYFLRDPAVEIIGYQVNFEELTLGIFLFNHSCNATLGIRAGDFRDLYNGPIFESRATGTEECPGYCLLQHELLPCPAQCECAYVREIIQVVKNYGKRSAEFHK